MVNKLEVKRIYDSGFFLMPVQLFGKFIQKFISFPFTTKIKMEEKIILII